MTVGKCKRHFDCNRDELHAIAKEFVKKIKDNPDVWGVVAKPYGAYLHVMTLIDWQIAKEQEIEIYHAELEIADKYDGQLLIEFDTLDCLSLDKVNEIAQNNPDDIIYQKGNLDAKRNHSQKASGTE